MSDAKQNLLALNIVLFIVMSIGWGLMTLWSRTTRGVWPNRKKVILLLGLNLLFWFFGNIMYFYFKSH